MCSAGSGVFLDKFFLQIWSVPWDGWRSNFFLLGGLDVRPATRRYNRSLTIVEREGTIFFLKTAQLPAGIKMWRQLWLKRKRPLDCTHREGKPIMYSILKLVDDHEGGSQEGYELDGSQNMPRNKTKPYKETDLGVKKVPRPALMNGVAAKENE